MAKRFLYESGQEYSYDSDGKAVHGRFCPDPYYRCVCGLHNAIEEVATLCEFLQVLYGKGSSHHG